MEKENQLSSKKKKKKKKKRKNNAHATHFYQDFFFPPAFSLSLQFLLFTLLCYIPRCFC